MAGPILRKHDEQFDFMGRRMRALVPVGRNDAVTTRVIDDKRWLVDLVLRDKDFTPMDLQNYRSDLSQCRERCGIVADVGDCWGRDKMAPVEMETGFRLLDGDPVRSYGDNNIQWNAAPGKGERGRAPPFTIGIFGAKDKNTKPGDKEYLVVSVNHFPTAGSQEQGICREIGRVEFVRSSITGVGYTHAIKARVENGQGGKGRAQVWYDGKLIADDEGPIGYPNFGVLYPALQIYRGQVPGERGFTNAETRARFDCWRECVAG